MSRSWALPWDWRFINMVHINLLPTEIRKEIQKKISASGSGIPLEVIVGSIGGVFLVLVLLHVVLATLTVQRLASYKTLEQQWKTLESRRTFIDGITKDLKDLKAEQGDIERLFSQTFREWSRTLNHFSSELPKGVWFGKLTVEKDEFVLQGSAITRDMDEIVAVNNYENKLQSNKFLQGRFKNFILDTVEKRKVQKVDVADFTIKSVIYPVSEEKQLMKDIEKNLPSAGSADQAHVRFDKLLPGVPEDAQANTRMMDQKPGTGTSQ